MKRIPSLLLPSFTSFSTTRCLLVKVTCKGAFEGQVFGFTNLDDTIVYEGVTYNFYNGFTPSAIETSTTTGVDNGEILGFMLEGITYEMVRAGLMNGATIECYEVDYMRLENGHTIEFVGKCGETKFSDNTFTTEIRSMTQGFTQAISQTYSKDYCRARFGDKFCKMPLTWTAGTVSGAWIHDTRRGFATPGLPADFFPGVIRWTSGRNAGDEMDVIQSDEGFVRLMLPMPFPIEPGDEYLIRPDCDKSVRMCVDKYNNEPNYRMEPLMNLTGDGLYSYTPAKIDNNYGSMIGAVIGAIIGYIFFYGNWQAGAQIGGAIGGLLLPDTMSGPRLSQAATQTNSTAAPIPYGWGKVSLSGNVIEDGKSEEHTKKKKNFLGITTEKTFTYTRSFKIGAMQGRINKYLEIRRGGKTVIRDGTRAELLFQELVSAGLVDSRADVFNEINTSNINLIYTGNFNAMRALILDIRALPDGGGIPSYLHFTIVIYNFGLALDRAKGLDKINTTGGDNTMRLFYGTEEQDFYACKNLDTKGLSPAYRGLAYIAYDDFDVTPTGGALDSFEFVIDASPGRFIGTSHPYVQFFKDAASARIAAVGGSLTTVMHKSDIEADGAAASIAAVGGSLYPPGTVYTEKDAALTAVAPTGGVLYTALRTGNIQDDAAIASVAPTGGSLKHPPVGNPQKDAASARIAPTSGSLTTV